MTAGGPIPAGTGGHNRWQAKSQVDKDRSAQLFARIVLPHLADGLALARWLAGNSADAEDIVQEACLRALDGIGGYAGGNARAWLLAIVRNTAFTWLARHRSRALVLAGDLADIDQVAPGAGFPGGEPPATPEAEAIRRADVAAVEAAIAELPLPFREILVLRDINGLGYKEIAELLDLPLGTVMSRLSRARQHLASHIGSTFR